ncbi:MAG: NAD(P)H-dependent dehydrogenase/reductase [Tindallia sp. MSAO_Bac2]|nr:MAG: NAD(P)H-dependent dehydrogenase/reductase [Tindallia sp. MSAO_Bac2]
MLEKLKSRRSIRKYEEKPIEKEKIDSIIEAALLSPSSKKNQPWEFLVVTDQELLTKLSLSKEAGSAFVKDAPVAVVVMADPEKSDVWIEDASIAATIIHLQAHWMGLGSCWIQLRNRQSDKMKTSEEYVRDLLEIPAGIRVEALVTMGYPAESKPHHKEENLLWEKVFLNQYGKKY